DPRALEEAGQERRRPPLVAGRIRGVDPEVLLEPRRRRGQRGSRRGRGVGYQKSGEEQREEAAWHKNKGGGPVSEAPWEESLNRFGSCGLGARFAATSTEPSTSTSAISWSSAASGRR